MRVLVGIIVAVFIMMWGCIAVLAINSGSDPEPAVSAYAGDGLDLAAVTALAKKASSPEDFEKKLNQPGGVNNLDLNEDGNVDFISVREYGTESDQEHGMSLTVEPAPGEVQEVADIRFFKSQPDNTGTNTLGVVQTVGSPQIFGAGYVMAEVVDEVGDFLLWSYIWSAHRPYFGGWGWGRYPSYHKPYKYRPYPQYKSYVSSNYSSSKIQKVAPSQMRTINVKNPNAGKTASTGITKTLRNPTATQKSFQARNPSKTVGSGGFGKSRSTGSSRSSGSSRGFGGSGK